MGEKTKMSNKVLDSTRPVRVTLLSMQSLINPTAGFYFWFWFSHARGRGGVRSN